MKEAQSLDGVDIIILPLPRWDGNYSSTIFSLAKEFSKTCRTFYLDNPFTIKDVITQYNEPQLKSRRELAKKGEWVYEIQEDLYAVQMPFIIPINFLPPGKFYDRLSKVNTRLIEVRVKELIKRYDVKKYVFINSYNPFYPINFPKNKKPQLTVYHCVDNIGASDYVGKHGLRLEEKMISDYDITVTTSKELFRLKSPFSNKIYQIPNAADIRLFDTDDKLEVPERMIQIDHPIVTYVGNIDPRLDFDLLEYLAENMKDVNFVFIGPKTSSQVSGLEVFSNVHFMGKMDISEIPAYLDCSDCAIIPFRCNELTKSIYPLKVNEYLAMGKPVVSTGFSEDIRDFEDIISIASTKETFMSAIQLAIQSYDKGIVIQRKERARLNNWEARGDEFLSIMALNT